MLYVVCRNLHSPVCHTTLSSDAVFKWRSPLRQRSGRDGKGIYVNAVRLFGACVRTAVGRRRRDHCRFNGIETDLRVGSIRSRVPASRVRLGSRSGAAHGANLEGAKMFYHSQIQN